MNQIDLELDIGQWFKIEVVAARMDLELDLGGVGCLYCIMSQDGPGARSRPVVQEVCELGGGWLLLNKPGGSWSSISASGARSRSLARLFELGPLLALRFPRHKAEPLAHELARTACTMSPKLTPPFFLLHPTGPGRPAVCQRPVQPHVPADAAAQQHPHRAAQKGSFTVQLQSSPAHIPLPPLQPPGELLPKAHQVEREFALLTSLHAAGFPVAKPLLLCEDPKVIGTPFYCMQFVEGRIFREPTLEQLPPAERRKIYGALVDVLR